MAEEFVKTEVFVNRTGSVTVFGGSGFVGPACGARLGAARLAGPGRGAPPGSRVSLAAAWHGRSNPCRPRRMCWWSHPEVWSPMRCGMRKRPSIWLAYCVELGAQQFRRGCSPPWRAIHRQGGKTSGHGSFCANVGDWSRPFGILPSTRETKAFGEAAKVRQILPDAIIA